MMIPRFLTKAAVSVAFVSFFCPAGLAQGTTAPDKIEKPAVQNAPAVLPKVAKIDAAGLKNLLKPNGKPLLINFWATWCDPCREEFPDLVKLDAAYRGKIDFITISLDDLADINTYVPKFLSEMKAEMPAFLLHTADENAVITMVSKDWKGNLPLTILFNAAGETAYSRNGLIKYATMTAEIDKVLAPAVSAPVTELILELPGRGMEYTFEKGVGDAERDIANGQYKIIRYGMTPGSAPTAELARLQKKYSLTVSETGCIVSPGFPDYARGYNQTTRITFEKKFGATAADKMGLVKDF